MKKIVFDTNVCGRLVEPAFKDKLNKIDARISSAYIRHIPPPTFLELLNGIRGGDGTFFDKDRHKIRILAGGGQPRFLSMPMSFGVQTVLGLETPLVEVESSELERSFQILMKAKDRDSLVLGQVEPNVGKRREGLNLDLISETIQEGKRQHLAAMDGLRRGNLQFPSSLEWATNIALQVGAKIDKVQASKLADGLDAAYRYDHSLFSRSRQNYNFEKNANDWIDSQYMFYLADDSISFVTDEEKFKTMTQGSHQEGRIILFVDFLKELGFELEASESVRR